MYFIFECFVATIEREVTLTLLDVVLAGVVLNLQLLLLLCRSAYRYSTRLGIHLALVGAPHNRSHGGKVRKCRRVCDAYVDMKGVARV
jgi:hypothetical protein